MKTKIVYVLTCAPERNFIEQALLSIYSARYWNPSVEIVLMTDDLTDKLFIGSRSTILNYITTKLVFPFEDDTLPPMYRSRWIKTQIRNLIEGDFLYIDCDTIVTHDLSEIDLCPYDIGATYESNLPIEDFHPDLSRLMHENFAKVGWNAEDVKNYFSGGVFYVKDTLIAHKLFERWHLNWLEELKHGIGIDQPPFAKANVDLGNVIQVIDNKWNCIMFTYPRWAKDAYILHFTAYKNMSFLFSSKVLSYVRNNGLTDFIKYAALHPTETYIPFESACYYFSLSDYIRAFKYMLRGAKWYSKHIDSSFESFEPQSGWFNQAYKQLRKHHFVWGTFWILLARFRRVKISRKFKVKENQCSK